MPPDAAGEPSRVGRLFLRAFSLIVDAVPTRGLDRQDGSARAQHLGCRFLLSLFVMDALAWGAFRIIQFEAIRNSRYADSFDTFGISPAIFVSVIVTLESTIEFLASAVAPTLYQLASRSSRFEVATLAPFCMRVYTFSHGCAFIVALAFAPCILGGANGPGGAEVDECDQANCGCGPSAVAGNNS
eukprot:1387513-Prymnesium_polylepis.2